MYAIVDIETTGGHASGNGITEIAIVLHDGHGVEGRFHTLLNPGQSIPRYIVSLTGITNEMVATAPMFEEVAPKIFNLLEGRIFVAHNVNFDYSFLKHHLSIAGYELSLKKLCTVRLARKVFPGLPSYSLGNLCRSLDIPVEDRHRALGDTMATVQLFERILQADVGSVVRQMLKGRSGDQYLPPHLPADQVNSLPHAPGVYYFLNQKQQILYVGKATNLHKRVKSHFSNNDGGKRKQDMMRQIYQVSYRTTPSELMALVLESQEIRRIWPPFNRSQKKFHQQYGLYAFTDQKGYHRLIIEKTRKNLPAIYTFNLIQEGQGLLRKISQLAELPLDQHGRTWEIDIPIEHYNKRIKAALHTVQSSLPSFVLLEENGHDKREQVVYLIEKGRFYGMGTVGVRKNRPTSIDEWKSLLEPCPDNDYVRGLIYQYAMKKPHCKIEFDQAT